MLSAQSQKGYRQIIIYDFIALFSNEMNVNNCDFFATQFEDAKIMY